MGSVWRWAAGEDLLPQKYDDSLFRGDSLLARSPMATANLLKEDETPGQEFSLWFKEMARKERDGTISPMVGPGELDELSSLSFESPAVATLKQSNSEIKQRVEVVRQMLDKGAISPQECDTMLERLGREAHLSPAKSPPEVADPQWSQKEHVPASAQNLHQALMKAADPPTATVSAPCDSPDSPDFGDTIQAPRAPAPQPANRKLVAGVRASSPNRVLLKRWRQWDRTTIETLLEQMSQQELRQVSKELGFGTCGADTVTVVALLKHIFREQSTAPTAQAVKSRPPPVPAYARPTQPSPIATQHDYIAAAISPVGPPSIDAPTSALESSGEIVFQQFARNWQKFQPTATAVPAATPTETERTNNSVEAVLLKEVECRERVMSKLEDVQQLLLSGGKRLQLPLPPPPPEVTKPVTTPVADAARSIPAVTEAERTAPVLSASTIQHEATLTPATALCSQFAAMRIRSPSAAAAVAAASNYIRTHSQAADAATTARGAERSQTRSAVDMSCSDDLESGLRTAGDDSSCAKEGEVGWCGVESSGEVAFRHFKCRWQEYQPSASSTDDVEEGHVETVPQRTEMGGAAVETAVPSDKARPAMQDARLVNYSTSSGYDHGNMLMTLSLQSHLLLQQQHQAHLQQHDEQKQREQQLLDYQLNGSGRHNWW